MFWLGLSIGLIALILMFLLFWFWPKNKSFQFKLETERLQKLSEENQIYRQKELDLEKKLSSLQSENKNFQEKLNESAQLYKEKAQEKEQSFQTELNKQKQNYEERLEEQGKRYREKMEEREKYFKEQTEKLNLAFENMAHKIFSENTKSYKEEASKNLSQTLQPFREDIEGFKKSVQGFESKGKFLDETLNEFRAINTKMRDETLSLTQALKGETKTQGQFGEFVLENILEKSGLRKNEEFFTQFHLKDEKGQSFRPDAIVKLPDHKYIIIDSKAPFKHYLEYSSSTAEKEREEAFKNMLSAVELHIKALSPKQYHFLSSEDKGLSFKGFRTPDFTLMFIPNEGIFTLITQAKDIFEKAWNQSIVLVSPTTLYATLRTIASIWKIERQNKNAREIAKASGDMYDKFVAFVEDLEKIGRGINIAQESYQTAFNKLEKGRGNLIRRAGRIKELGAEAKKKLPDKYVLDSDEELSAL